MNIFLTIPLLLGYEMHNSHEMMSISNDVVANLLVTYVVHVTMSFIINLKSNCAHFHFIFWHNFFRN